MCHAIHPGALPPRTQVLNNYEVPGSLPCLSSISEQSRAALCHMSYPYTYQRGGGRRGGRGRREREGGGKREKQREGGGKESEKEGVEGQEGGREREGANTM